MGGHKNKKKESSLELNKVKAENKITSDKIKIMERLQVLIDGHSALLDKAKNCRPEEKQKLLGGLKLAEWGKCKLKADIGAWEGRIEALVDVAVNVVAAVDEKRGAESAAEVLKLKKEIDVLNKLLAKRGFSEVAHRSWYGRHVDCKKQKWIKDREMLMVEEKIREIDDSAKEFNEVLSKLGTLTQDRRPEEEEKD